jgi:hypothetical protein
LQDTALRSGEAFGLPLAQIGPRAIGISGAEQFGIPAADITWRPEHNNPPSYVVLQRGGWSRKIPDDMVADRQNEAARAKARAGKI